MFDIPTGTLAKSLFASYVGNSVAFARNRMQYFLVGLISFEKFRYHKYIGLQFVFYNGRMLIVYSVSIVRSNR